MTLPAVLRRYWAWTAAMTAVAVAYSTVTTVLLKLPVPYGLPNYFGDFAWFDFVVYKDRFRLFGKPGFWEFKDYLYTYPALTGVMYKVFYSVPHSLLTYLGLCCVGLAVWLVALVRGMVARGVAPRVAWGFGLTLLLCCYPVLLLLTSGNMEGVMAIVMGLGVWGLVRGRMGWAAAAFGFAGAMKIYPLILLGLLLSRRRYKEFGLGLAVAAGLDYASLRAMGPTAAEAQRQIDRGLAFVRETLVVSTSRFWLPFNHSLFYAFKYPVAIAGRLLRVHDERALLERAFAVYVVAALLGAAAIYFLRLRKLPMLNQLLGLTVMGVLFAPMSGDYTLIQLLVPVMLLCWYACERPQAAGLRASFFCLPFVFTAGTYFAAWAQFAAQVRTAALAALLVVVLRFGFAWQLLDGEAA